VCDEGDEEKRWRCRGKWQLGEREKAPEDGERAGGRGTNRGEKARNGERGEGREQGGNAWASV
jgi:hypothetical protein